jgi:TetR/AcrR family transcriptional regulator, transcriptional repressor for nem operon
MDTAVGRKEQSHDRIVEVASRAIRRSGCSSLAVADVMKQAGLTHGGFYAHFSSRDALVAEAIERAGRDLRAQMEEQTRRAGERGVSPLRVYVEIYLSEQHLEEPETGCPVGALVSEMPHQAPDALAASAGCVRGLIQGVQQTLPPGAGAKERATVIASTLVGALQLARTLGANAQGRGVLAAARKAILEQYDD